MFLLSLIQAHFNKSWWTWKDKNQSLIKTEFVWKLRVPTLICWNLFENKIKAKQNQGQTNIRCLFVFSIPGSIQVSPQLLTSCVIVFLVWQYAKNRQIYLYSFAYCHTETAVSHLQSHLVTRPSNPSTDPKMPGVWYSNHKRTSFQVIGITWLGVARGCLSVSFSLCIQKRFRMQEGKTTRKHCTWDSVEVTNPTVCT